MIEADEGGIIKPLILFLPIRCGERNSVLREGQRA